MMCENLRGRNMQVQKISFTSIPDKKEQTQSSLYNKQNFVQIGAINDFIAGSAIGFGVLESRSKYKLLKQKNTLPDALKHMAKKQTRNNIFIGLGIGALYTALDVLLFNRYSNKIEATYDKLDKLEKEKN